MIDNLTWYAKVIRHFREMPVFPKGHRPIWKPYLCLFILQVLDVLTTAFLLHHYSSAAEGNPIAKFIIKAGWVGFPCLFILKTIAVYLLWHRQSKIRLISTIYGAVIVNNLLFVYLHFFGT